MNKRIYELVEQSRDLVQRKTMLGGDMYVPGPIERGDVNLEKFAELIVIECAKIASDSVIDHSGHSETNICPKYLACHIKDHFGVEG